MRSNFDWNSPATLLLRTEMAGGNVLERTLSVGSLKQALWQACSKGDPTFTDLWLRLDDEEFSGSEIARLVELHNHDLAQRL